MHHAELVLNPGLLGDLLHQVRDKTRELSALLLHIGLLLQKDEMGEVECVWMSVCVCVGVYGGEVYVYGRRDKPCELSALLLHTRLLL